MFLEKVEEYFKVETVISEEMQREQGRWRRTYKGTPDWESDIEGAELESINFAKTLCSETARLTTLALGITVEGSARAEWIQDKINNYIADMTKDKCEYACAMGYMLLRPGQTGIDYVFPEDFIPTDIVNGKIWGGIFVDRQQKGDKYYTRYEYHRFEDALYRITNKAFVSTSEDENGKEIDLEMSPWKDLLEEAYIGGIERPLFAVFGMPLANNIEMGSSIPVSVFSNAMKELKRLDIAAQRLADETDDSKKITLLGDAFITSPGEKLGKRFGGIRGGVRDTQGNLLPRYMRYVATSTEGSDYHEIVPKMNTEERIRGINHLLDVISVKCGFSAGYFVIDGRTGKITATQVESDDRATIQTIKQIRDSLQTATDDLIYALDKWADLYDITPSGSYKTEYDFGDITYNEDEDRARNWQYVQAGRYPFWRYLVKFEGYSEKDAKEIVEEMKAENADKKGLFDEE